MKGRGIEDGILQRLKQLAAPGEVIEPLKSDWEDPDLTVGVQVAVPSEGFDSLLESLRSEWLPEQYVPFAPCPPWKEYCSVRTLGVVPGTGDSDLLELLQTTGAALEEEMDSPEIVRRLDALRDAYGLHVVCAGSFWVEIVLHTLPEDWEEFLEQVGGFKANGTFDDWYAEAERRSKADLSGDSPCVPDAAERERSFMNHLLAATRDDITTNRRLMLVWD